MEIFPNWTAIPIIILLILLVFVLNRLFFRPMAKTLEERERRIGGARREAEEIRQSIQNRASEFDRKMRDARREADLQIAEVKTGALQEKGQVIAKQRVETQQMLAEARTDIRAKTEEAARTLKKQADVFAVKIASQILKRPLQRKNPQA